MIKHLSLCIALIFSITLHGQNLSKVREAYTTASQSKESATAFAKLMANTLTTDAVLSAYKGASKMILAKFGGNRVALLKEGKPLIENALKEQPNNAELHLIRLSVQENLPKVVPYRNHITADKDFLIVHYGAQSHEMQRYIDGFVARSKVFSKDDKEKIYKAIKE